MISLPFLIALVNGNPQAYEVLRYVGSPMVGYLLVGGEGELSLEPRHEKETGEVSLENVLLEEYPMGEESRRDRLDLEISIESLKEDEDDSDDNSSVGENDGRKALGSRGVEVRDLVAE